MTKTLNQISLGEFTDLILNLPDATEVQVAPGVYPEGVTSYRGYYEDLALEFGSTPINARELGVTLIRANGKEFTGYKGGEFYMDDDTAIWLANYGSCGRAITGIEYDEAAGVATIKTEED